MKPPRPGHPHQTGTRVTIHHGEHSGKKAHIVGHVEESSPRGSNKRALVRTLEGKHAVEPYENLEG